jgi:hypothetical protein
MKRSFLIYGLLISQLVIAQPVTKVYAYSQAFTPGIVPQREIAEEPGKAVQKSHTKINYYIYIKLGSSVTVQPKQIWIMGKWFKIIHSSQVKTPIYAEGPGKKLLVPSTGYKVLQVQPGDTLQSAGKISTALKKMMSSSELILAYSYKGMTYYSAVKKITVLDRVQGI